MRHLYGTALAVVMTLVMFFAGAWGYAKLLRLAGQPTALPAGGDSVLGTGPALIALAALIGTAVLAGLLVISRRVSPLAAGLPGALLLGWTVLGVISERQAVALIPLRSQSFGAGWEALLLNGMLGAAGAVLILPAVVPSRWQELRAATPDTAPVPAVEPLPAVWADARRRPPEPLRRPAPAPFDQLPASPRPADPRLADPRPEEVPALTGTVLSYPASSAVRPVDTTRVTGASRALRATGSFQAVPGATPSTGGWFGQEQDGGRRGRPYYQSPDEQPPPGPPGPARRG